MCSLLGRILKLMVFLFEDRLYSHCRDDGHFREDRGACADGATLVYLASRVQGRATGLHDFFRHLDIFYTASFGYLPRILVNCGRICITAFLLPRDCLFFRHLFGVHLLHLLCVSSVEII